MQVLSLFIVYLSFIMINFIESRKEWDKYWFSNWHNRLFDRIVYMYFAHSKHNLRLEHPFISINKREWDIWVLWQCCYFKGIGVYFVYFRWISFRFAEGYWSRTGEIYSQNRFWGLRVDRLNQRDDDRVKGVQ